MIEPDPRIWQPQYTVYDKLIYIYLWFKASDAVWYMTDLYGLSHRTQVPEGEIKLALRNLQEVSLILYTLSGEDNLRITLVRPPEVEPEQATTPIQLELRTALLFEELDKIRREYPSLIPGRLSVSRRGTPPQQAFEIAAQFPNEWREALEILRDYVARGNKVSRIWPLIVTLCRSVEAQRKGVPSGASKRQGSGKVAVSTTSHPREYSAP